MRRLLVTALLVAACNRTQSSHDAIAILCGSEQAPDDPLAFHDWLATRITNHEVQAFLAHNADTDPWDLDTKVHDLANHEGIDACHPLDGLIGIRAANGVDVPELSGPSGTAETSRAPIVAITAKRIAIEGRGRVDPTKLDAVQRELAGRFTTSTALVAADRTLAMSTVLPVLDAIKGAGASHLRLLVTAPKQSRELEIETRLPAGADGVTTQTVIELGSIITVNGEVVAPAMVHDAIARAAAGRVFVVPEPQITVQQLAETMAAAGGRVYLGRGLLPAVTPSAPSP